MRKEKAENEVRVRVRVRVRVSVRTNILLLKMVYLTLTLTLTLTLIDKKGLQATLEKLKIDHEGKEKKWRMNEKRLQQLGKDNMAHSEELEQQILALEQDKQSMWNYLDSINVRLPGSLIRSMSRKKEEHTVKTSNLGFGSTVTPKDIGLGLRA
jgi:hypothetical protein